MGRGAGRVPAWTHGRGGVRAAICGRVAGSETRDGDAGRGMRLTTFAPGVAGGTVVASRFRGGFWASGGVSQSVLESCAALTQRIFFSPVARSDTCVTSKKTLQILGSASPSGLPPIGLRKPMSHTPSGAPHRPLPCTGFPAAWIISATRANVLDAACRRIYPQFSRLPSPIFSHLGSRGRRSGCVVFAQLHANYELILCISHHILCCIGR